MNIAALIVPTLVTAAVLYLSMVAQRFAGPGSAGLVAALPIQLAIGSLGVAAGMGDGAVAAFALTAATYLPAQIAYGVAFTDAMRRWGFVAALASGMVSYSVLTLLLGQVSHIVSIAAGVVAVIIGPRLIQSRTSAMVLGDRDSEPNPFVVIGLGTFGVLSVIALVNFAGPAAGAFMAAVPVVTPILSFFLMRSMGREAGAETMAGMIRGLPSCLVFALSLAFLSEPIGTIAAVVIGLTLCVALSAFVWKLTTNPSSRTNIREDHDLAA